jgi:conjugative transposon TraN protein
MKKIIILFCTICLVQNIFAQARIGNYTVLNNNVSIAEENVNTATIPWNSTTHFVSPEPIQYVDISSPNIQGDLPEKNIFRMRPDSNKVHPGDKFTITIVTQAYIYVISINPNNAVQINQSDVLNDQQCFDIAVRAMKRNRSIFNIETKAYGMKMYVKNIYSIGDYIMIELAAKNKTRLQFDIDQIRFKIVDKHSVKATVSQDIELKPFYSLYQPDGKIITNGWHNFYIFKKFTFPTQKLLEIEMTEKQYSGRRVDLKIEYNQILKSQQLN